MRTGKQSGVQSAIGGREMKQEDRRRRQSVAELGASRHRIAESEARESERKHAEEALRESEERYRGVVETQTELVDRSLPDGTITFVNEACARHFGKKPEEMIGQSFLPLVPEEDHDKLRK